MVLEAAVRHASFKAAADELGVTPGAVSHQIKALERGLGVALFARRARGVEPTSAGEAPLSREARLLRDWLLEADDG